jgi:hypothetical protein
LVCSHCDLQSEIERKKLASRLVPSVDVVAALELPFLSEMLVSMTKRGAFPVIHNRVVAAFVVSTIGGGTTSAKAGCILDPNTTVIIIIVEATVAIVEGDIFSDVVVDALEECKSKNSLRVDDDMDKAKEGVDKDNTIIPMTRNRSLSRITISVEQQCLAVLKGEGRKNKQN